MGAVVDDLSKQSDTLFAQWTKRLVEAEAAYHMAVAEMWQQASQNL